jgi:hypothetical protein
LIFPVIAAIVILGCAFCKRPCDRLLCELVLETHMTIDCGPVDRRRDDRPRIDAWQLGQQLRRFEARRSALHRRSQVPATFVCVVEAGFVDLLLTVEGDLQSWTIGREPVFVGTADRAHRQRAVFAVAELFDGTAFATGRDLLVAWHQVISSLAGVRRVGE